MRNIIKHRKNNEHRACSLILFLSSQCPFPSDRVKAKRNKEARVDHTLENWWESGRACLLVSGRLSIDNNLPALPGAYSDGLIFFSWWSLVSEVHTVAASCCCERLLARTLCLHAMRNEHRMETTWRLCGTTAEGGMTIFQTLVYCWRVAPLAKW